MTGRGPHSGQPVRQLGVPLEQASAAMVLVHGRGASAADILTIAQELMAPGWTYLAPEAAGGTWYPERFMAPIEVNEPWLSSALEFVGGVISTAGRSVPEERIILLGFSQGACLTLEYAARNARRYAALIGLSGGLIGPDTGPRDYAGSLDGTPVFLGCSDVDPHIPKDRVDHAAQVLEALGGQVTTRIYPRMGHTVNPDEVDFVRALAAGGSGAETP